MSKIISIIIKFLNRINKFIWKICIFLSSLIPVEEIDKLNNKPTNERYRHFKVEQQPIVEPFVTIEHKDHKQLIKDNNIKPVKYRNGKEITINIKCHCCNAPKEYLYNNNGKQTQFKCKVCSFTFTLKLLERFFTSIIAIFFTLLILIIMSTLVGYFFIIPFFDNKKTQRIRFRKIVTPCYTCRIFSLCSS